MLPTWSRPWSVRHRSARGSLPGLILFLACLIFSLPAGAQNPGHPLEFNLQPKQRAEWLLGTGQFQKALEAFKAIVEVGEGDAYVFRNLIKSYQGAGLLDQGETYIRTYLSRHPGSSAALYGMGYLRFLQKRTGEAGTYFQKAVEADPQNALAWNNWGAVLDQERSYNEAVEKVLRAIRTDPGELMFYRNLQIIYKDMGVPEKFRSEFEQLVREGPKEKAAGYGKTLARSLRQEGFSLYAQERLDDAIGKLQEMVKVYEQIEYQGGLVPGYFSLGLLFEEKGDKATARKYFQKVLDINPDHIQAREKIKEMK